MDGPNVNWAVQREMVALKSNGGETCPQLLELGSCGLHVLHGAFEAGHKNASWPTKKLLKAAHQFLSTLLPGASTIFKQMKKWRKTVMQAPYCSQSLIVVIGGWKMVRLFNDSFSWPRSCVFTFFICSARSNDHHVTAIGKWSFI